LFTDWAGLSLDGLVFPIHIDVQSDSALRHRPSSTIIISVAKVQILIVIARDKKYLEGEKDEKKGNVSKNGEPPKRDYSQLYQQN
jgi:hypothetical protein